MRTEHRGKTAGIAGEDDFDVVGNLTSLRQHLERDVRDARRVAAGGFDETWCEICRG